MPLLDSLKTSDGNTTPGKILLTTHGRSFEQDFWVAKLALTVLVMEGVQETKIMPKEV